MDRAIAKAAGGSGILYPLGTVLVEPDANREQIHTAELDLGAIALSKYGLDVAGHYARPDIFNLAVNRRPQRPVSFDGDPNASAVIHPVEGVDRCSD